MTEATDKQLADEIERLVALSEKALRTSPIRVPTSVAGVWETRLLLDGNAVADFKDAVAIWFRANIAALRREAERELVHANEDDEQRDVRAAWFEVMKHLCRQRPGGYASYLDMAQAIIAEREPPSGMVMDALRESIKLQNHYATILNDHDGGKRLTFTVESWLERLQTLSAAEAGKEGKP